jgi:ABC-2 type transport system permease protein
MMKIKGLKIKGIEDIKESFKTRQVKYGGYAALLTLAVIAALILVNLIAGQFSPQVDLTYSKIYSLSEQTLQVLETVKTPVRFYGLWRPGDENQDVINVVNLYLSKNRNISLEVVDPDRNPGFVVKYDKERQGIQRGSLIVEGEKGFKVIAPGDMYDYTASQSGGSSVTGVAIERRITNALLYAGTGNTPVVYEITGHGETPLSAFGMQDTVERENFTLKSLNLLVATIPSDASALILNNPQRDLAPAEAQKLLNYLEQGGRLLVMASYNIRELSGLNEVLASYGLEFIYGIVRETDLYYIAMDPSTEWPDVSDHEITRPLADKTKTPVVLVEAMALSLSDTKRRTVEISPLMTSSPGAFIRTDLNEVSVEKVPSDISGPLILGAAVTDPSWIENNEPQARIVAIGCGYLLDLAVMGLDANRDLFMNSLTWLEDRPETISVRSKSLFILPLRMNMLQIIIFGVLFIFVIPAAFFICGLVAWLKRRHL